MYLGFPVAQDESFKAKLGLEDAIEKFAVLTAIALRAGVSNVRCVAAIHSVANLRCLLSDMST